LSRAVHLADESDGGLEDRLREFAAIGTVRPGQFTSYFPLALDPGTDLMVNTMALILCFLPFVLAILRYGIVIDKGEAEAPEDAVLRDRALLFLGVAWLVLFGLGALGV